MINITIRTVPHDKQRYDTVGDWQINDPMGAQWEITVSELHSWKMEVAVAVHELVECALCRYAGIGQEAVDNFDVAYKGEGEPGDDVNAPYHPQHLKATAVEHFVLACLGVTWKDYEGRCQKPDSTSSAKPEMAQDSQCG